MDLRVDGDVCAGVLRGMCVLGVEGDVRWGGEGDVCAGC